MFLLVWRGVASYRYITWYSDEMIIDASQLYYIFKGDCCKLVEFYSRDLDFYGFLLRNNCSWLKKFMHGTERSWYLAYAFLPYINDLASKYLVSTTGRHTFTR